MKALLLPYSFLFLIILIACTSKPMYKTLTDIRPGDSKSIVTEAWGKPDRIIKSANNPGKRELWVYECTAYVDCDESPDCRFSAPCYIVLLINGVVADIHSSQ